MKKTVLVVDDDPSIVEVIHIILEDEGYQVLEVKHDQDIEQVIAETQPDLILLDIWIWGKDGRDIAQFVRNTKQLAETPIIMISAKNDLSDIAQTSGADEFLSKPFDIDELTTKVSKLMPQLPLVDSQVVVKS